VATETILAVLDTAGVKTGIDPVALSKALEMVAKIFPNH
jgi:hypothetical protein